MNAMRRKTKITCIVASALIIFACLILLGINLKNEKDFKQTNNKNTPVKNQIMKVTGGSVNDVNEYSTNGVDATNMQMDHIDSDVLDTLKPFFKKPFSQSLETYEERWYKEVASSTKARLSKQAEPQSISGKILFTQLYEEINTNEPMIVYTKSRHHPASYSLVLDGQYSLGTLDPDVYQLLFKQTSRTPAVWVHDVNIIEGQPASKHDWELGSVTALVKVYDKNDLPMVSDNIDLFIGGVSDKVHTWKTAKTIKGGVWTIRYLLPDDYIVRAKWKEQDTTKLVTLKPGENTVELRLCEDNARAVQ